MTICTTGGHGLPETPHRCSLYKVPKTYDEVVNVNLKLNGKSSKLYIVDSF